MFLSTCPAFQQHQQQLRQFDFPVERFKTNGDDSSQFSDKV
jgi:hypothetical protein